MNHNLKEEKSIQPFFERFRSLLRERIGDKPSPLILIQGGFGKHNTGDDTLLRVASRQVRAVYPGARIIALCHNPAFLMESYGIEGVRFQSLRTIRLLFACDALVLASGGLVNHIDFTSVLRSIVNPRGKFTFLTAWTVLLRKKITVAFGVGIHQVPDPVVRFLMNRVLPRMSLICVRDKYSVDTLERMGIKNYYFAHDPALVFEPEKEFDWEAFREKYQVPDGPVVMFNYRYTKDEKETQNAISVFAKYIDFLEKKYPGTTLLMVPFSIHPTFPLENDVTAFEELKKTAVEKYGVKNICLVDDYQTADEIKGIAGHAELLVLTRHHAPVLTYDCGAPTIVVSYNLKCREFAELGGYEYTIDYDKLNLEKLVEISEKILGFPVSKKREEA